MQETDYSLMVYLEKDQYSDFCAFWYQKNGLVGTGNLQVDNLKYQKLAVLTWDWLRDSLYELYQFLTVPVNNDNGEKSFILLYNLFTIFINYYCIRKLKCKTAISLEEEDGGDTMKQKNF